MKFMKLMSVYLKLFAKTRKRNSIQILVCFAVEKFSSGWDHYVTNVNGSVRQYINIAILFLYIYTTTNLLLPVFYR